MRHAFVLLHRWVGLTIAAFLFVAGVTGAVISWDHELDDLLNPHLHEATGAGAPIPALELARRIEAADPRARVAYLPLAPEPGEALSVFVQPRVDPASGHLYDLGYNQVFVDPATGTELGRREWGRAWPISRETLVSFLYKLHYSLHVPALWGVDRWGIWLMGGVAVLWALDCFVGFYLTLPPRKRPNPHRPPAVNHALERGWWARWKPAWTIKTSGSGYRITFDLHRALSLWTWGLLFILGFTAFSLNLYREAFHPLMSLVSQVTPTPYETRTPSSFGKPIEPAIDRGMAVERARAEGVRQGLSEPIGAIFYDARYGFYTASFFRPGDDHGAGGVGPAKLYLDGGDGRLIGERRPWSGTVADIFVQAQFPLHSGRILGLPGRILISLMGLVVAALSVTGVAIWWRKRAARVSVRRPRHAGALAQPAE